MAARTVLKLFTKTCSYSLNGSNIPTFSPEKVCQRHQRSFSQPRRCQHSIPKELFIPSRKVSRSLENLRQSRRRSEVDQVEEEEVARTPYPIDTSYRDAAKEFKEKIPIEEKNEEGNPIYEIEAARNEDNYFDVLDFMRKVEEDKVHNLYIHLQPCSLKPYGSNDNLHYPKAGRKSQKIVYPSVVTNSTEIDNNIITINQVQTKDFSSYNKVYPANEETKKVAICEPKKTINKMKYSTVPLKNDKIDSKTKLQTRKSSTAFIKKKKKEPKSAQNELLENQKSVVDQPKLKLSDYQKSRKKRPDYLGYLMKNYNTEAESIRREDFVTVKLGDLQEECRREQRCKPKKISFGRLPKLSEPDCPCYEDMPLKEGKPLNRLKKRFDIKDRDNICPDNVVCTTPRADANYKIKAKPLRPIVAQDCPCERKEMTDLVIHRLPKKKIKEPPKVCICAEKECCVTPRADGKMSVKKKKLPVLPVNDCPCIENDELKTVPLKRLPPVEIIEPVKDCSKSDLCHETPRADQNLKITQKSLPLLKPDCVCIEGPEMVEGKPLPRLPKMKLKEKPKQSCDVIPCADAVRADDQMSLKKKKLPTFVPQDCPCTETEGPSKSFNLKRLKPVTIPEPVKVCPEIIQCGPRADDGLTVKAKQLPQIELQECPCVELELVDGPPLKRLVAKKIEQRKIVCKAETCKDTPRADKDLKVAKKVLPKLTPANCPCVEPPTPLDVKPLKKLKKKEIVQKRKCQVKEEECQERADENLKVKIKKLPKLEVPDCPCYELTQPEDVPLRRLKKVIVPEPVRVCKKEDSCEESIRADEDDWLYWKRVEVKSPQSDGVDGKNRRSFSTISRRCYSTRTVHERNVFNLNYDLPIVPLKQCDSTYNIIIDIKPSAPLVLTQRPILEDQDLCLRRTRSEPVDCVAFVIYKGKLCESTNDMIFNTVNRFLSTCTTLCEAKDKKKDCECPKRVDHLQPKYPIIAEKETFINTYPSDVAIEKSAFKSRIYYRTRKDEREDQGAKAKIIEECPEEIAAMCEEEKVCEPEKKAPVEKQLTMWEKIVNYFKARPNCPSPKEFKKMRLKEDAERAAEKAGLCLYDPKEMLRRNEKDLPKVITADSFKNDCSK